jgi:hypothetical protein
LYTSSILERGKFVLDGGKTTFNGEKPIIDGGKSAFAALDYV